MEKSFINEHTAELVLVPKLICGLQSVYPKITPVFFWASREGGVISRESFQDVPLKILALYARRPKINDKERQIVSVKLNELLFYRARFLKSEGISVIAGAPLASTLDGIHLDCDCLWLDFDQNGSEETVSINLTDRSVCGMYAREISFKGIQKMIETSKTFSWPELISKLKTMRHRLYEDNVGYFNRLLGDVYKPVYLLIHPK